MDNQNFSYSDYSKKSYSEIFFPEKLKPITQLLKESWKIYRLKFKILLGIIGLPIGFSFLFWILTCFLTNTSIKYSVWFSVINAISYLGSFFLWLWAIPSLLYNLKENTGIKESYKRGFKILGPYIWAYFLLTTIIAGGFLLFIIPGILFSIWFSLAIFILVFEERKGFNALFRSKYLVKGKFWGVLGRFLLLGLIIGLGLFLVFIFGLFGIENKQTESQISEVIGYFIQLFILPFFLIYGFLIYNNLKKIKAETLSEKPTRNKKIKYVIPGIFGILIIGLLFSFFLLNIFWGRDIHPIDDSDLWLSKIEIPKEENAFYLLNQASEKIYLPKEKLELFIKMAKGEKWDSEFAKELIESNKEVFSYFEKALKLPYFQIPDWQDPKAIGDEASFPNMLGLRDITYLNSIKASYLLTQGKDKEALDLIVKTIKMGQIIEDSPRPILSSYLESMAIKEIGLQRLRTMMPNINLSPEVLKNYVTTLNQFEANEQGLMRMMKMEYIIFSNVKSKFDAAIAGKLPKKELEKLGIEENSLEIKTSTKLNYLYKPNQTQQIFAEYYRNLVNNANKDYSEMKLPEIKPFLASYSKIKTLFTENVVGKILRNSVAVRWIGIFEEKCLEDFSVKGTQSLIAIKAYKTKTGKIPPSLGELVPEYLSEIPKDPFNGKLIKYSPEKRIIYSVGKDLKDSGGSEGESWQIMEDPTFKIEF